MPSTSFVKRVRHRPEDIMGLVADVENYTQFISFFSALRVTKRRKMSEHHEQFEATAVISYKFLSETFRSVVDVHHDSRRIYVAKADKGGAVKSLRNDWAFFELSDGSTLVDFEVDVRLKAYPLEILAREKFPKVANKVMGLFLSYASETCEIVGEPSLDMAEEMARLSISKPLTA